MWTPMVPLRWRWKDLPIRQKGPIVIAAPIAPLPGTTVLPSLARARGGRARTAAAERQRCRTDLEAAVQAE